MRKAVFLISWRFLNAFLPDFDRRNFLRIACSSAATWPNCCKERHGQRHKRCLAKNPPAKRYSRLGVKTVINCRGTWTYLSGSLEFPEVAVAQREASEYFVNMFELQHAASRRLAELTGAEAGMSRLARLARWPPPPRPAWPAAMQSISGNFPTPLD